MDPENDSENEIIGPIPGSPTPVRINNRNIHIPPPSTPTSLKSSNNNNLSSKSSRPFESSSSSPTSSPRKRGKILYGDRYIPNRSGINLQAAFSLAKDDVASSSQSRRPNSNELDFQRVEEANRTFSTLLKAELFGDDVPSAIPTLSNSHQGGLSMASSGGSLFRSSNRGGINGGAVAGAPSAANTPETSHGSSPNDGSKTPPRITRSAPVTPNKNIFRYSSPTQNSVRTVGGNTGFGRNIADGFDSIIDSQSEVYSVSPVRMDSQRILMSPRKQPRAVSKIPYKVLDAPELADDFYLNLVDWGSQNILGVGLGSCVYLWHAQTTAVQKLCDLGTSDRVTSISWIKQGTHLAVGTDKGLVQIWDAEKKKRIRTMTGHESRAGSLAWNEQILSSGSRDRSILHRDVRVPQHYITKLSGHRQEVCGLKWNVEENQLASGGNDNKLIIWDKLNQNPLYKFNDHMAAVKAIAWSPHQRGLLASGGGTADRRIRFWNTLTGTCLNSVDTGSQVCNLGWSKNSNELVSTHGYSQNQIVIWKYPSMQQVAALTGHSYRVLYLAMSPDGRTIVTGAGDETLRFWDVFAENRVETRGRSSLLDAFQLLR